MCNIKARDGCIIELLELKPFFQSPHMQIFSHTRPLSQPTAFLEAEHALFASLQSSLCAQINTASLESLGPDSLKPTEAASAVVYSATRLQTSQVSMVFKVLNLFIVIIIASTTLVLIFI